MTRLPLLSAPLLLILALMPEAQAMDIPCPARETERLVAPPSIYHVTLEQGEGAEVLYRIRLDSEHQSKPLQEIYIYKARGTDLVLIAPLGFSRKEPRTVETYFMADDAMLEGGFSLLIRYASSEGYCPDLDAKIFLLQMPPNKALHPPLDPARLALPLQAACVKGW